MLSTLKYIFLLLRCAGAWCALGSIHERNVIIVCCMLNSKQQNQIIVIKSNGTSIENIITCCFLTSTVFMVLHSLYGEFHFHVCSITAHNYDYRSFSFREFERILFSIFDWNIIHQTFSYQLTANCVPFGFLNRIKYRLWHNYPGFCKFYFFSRYNWFDC